MRPGSLIIRNVHIINSDEEKDADVFISDGIIMEIGKGLRSHPSVQEIDGKGLWLLPGAIDIHFHIREPGYYYEEDMISGTRAAAHGGITSLFMMPNTTPPVDSPEMVAFVKERAKLKAKVRVFPVGAATEGRKGEKITEYGLMLREGIVAVSDDGNAIKSPLAMRKALEYARTFGITVIEHPEEKELSGDANEGILTLKYGLTPYPTMAESIIVARDIIICKTTGGYLHFTHISSAESIELIKNAKDKMKDEKKVRITFDVTPHHLLLCDEDIDITNTSFKVNPPLRSKEDREKLISTLSEGLVDIIASDHAPHPDFEKMKEFPSAPPGISQADIFLPICFKLVQDGVLNERKIVELISKKPAEIFGIDGGEVKEGKPADVVIFSPDEETHVKEDEIFSKGKNCPYIGWKLKGKVKVTIVAGTPVFSDGTLMERIS